MSFVLSKEFSEKKAVIIGASGKIGSFIAKELAPVVKDLVIHCDSQEVSLANATVIQEHFDCLSPNFYTSIENSRIIQEIQTADILIICLGPFLQKPLHEMTFTQWNHITTLNYSLPGFFVSQGLQNMLTKKWGRIILFGGSRTDAVMGFKTNAAYAGAKTALSSLAKSVALAYGDRGITCNVILPGQLENESPENFQKKAISLMPENKGISLETIKNALFLLLSSSEYNGTLLRIDRGWQ